MRFITLILLMILVGCSHKKHKQQDAVEKKESYNITPTEINIRQGEVELLSVIVKEVSDNTQLYCGDRRIPFEIKDGRLQAFTSETYFSKFDRKTCILKSNEEKVVANLRGVEKEFPHEKLTVAKKRVFLSKKNQKRVAKEREHMNKVYSSSSGVRLFDQPFILPINSIETSIYGTRRIYNNKKKSQHLGTDFRAPVGVPIKSSNSGKVVAARYLFYTGYTVVVDHGMNIFTIYAHLSKLKVNEGDYIPRGEVLGLAGATGRVTGPHLHWGVLVNNLAVEGHTLIKASEKYFNHD